jgi:transmembrane sensor
VHAGRQSRFDRHHVDPGEAADPMREAWTRGVLLADDMPLADFVAELSRYQRGFVTCTPEVARLRLVGAYPLAQPEQIYRALARSLPVRVSRPMPWWVRIEAA